MYINSDEIKLLLQKKTFFACLSLQSAYFLNNALCYMAATVGALLQ